MEVGLVVLEQNDAITRMQEVGVCSTLASSKCSSISAEQSYIGSGGLGLDSDAGADGSIGTGGAGTPRMELGRS